MEKTRIIAIFVIAGILTGLTILNTKTSISKLEEEKSTQEVNYTTTTETTLTTSKNASTTKVKKATQKATTKVGTYTLTHYGHDCKKCSGITASNYDVRNTIYYNDATYGILRIVAMKDLSLYSVIKINNYKLGGDIYAIVLDRGVGSGVIDLAVENESKASQLGIQNNVEIEIIRSGK